MNLRWKGAFGLALFNDALDLAGIGAIPVIGDILDVATSLLLWTVLGTRYTAPTLLEFIPGADFLPIYTVTVAVAYARKKEQDSEDGSMKEIDIK